MSAITSRYPFEFEDGSTCEMTLAFILLKKMASKHKDAYAKCQKVLTNGAKDEFDMLAVLYGAYVCANMDSENLMSENDFIEKCGCDRVAMMEAFQTMTNPKKRKVSGNLSD